MASKGYVRFDDNNIIDKNVTPERNLVISPEQQAKTPHFQENVKP